MVNTRGYTLVEFMIAAALSLGMIATIVSVYLSIKQHYLYADALAQINEKATVIVNVLGYDIRMAGFADCKPLKRAIDIAHNHITVYRANSELLSWQQFMARKWRNDARFVVASCDASQVVSLTALQNTVGPRSVISSYIENTYYIADTHRRYRDGRKIFSLYLKPLNRPSMELVEDVAVLKATQKHGVVILHVLLNSFLAHVHRSFDFHFMIRNYYEA